MEKKIIDFKIIESSNIEDFDRQCYTGWLLRGGTDSKPEPIIQKGLNSLAKDLIEQGYVPYGELKLHSRVYHGKHEFVDTTFAYTKEFVKYEP